MMGVVRNHQCFERDLGCREASDKVGALREPDVAIVIAMNQEYGRSPAGDGRDRRRVPGGGERRVDVGSLLVTLAVECSRIGRPVVHTMDIDTSGEELGVA